MVTVGLQVHFTGIFAKAHTREGDRGSSEKEPGAFNLFVADQ